ncbi:hypothetical protein KIN20_032012 [Parelaphostrongylus tenuis]|uniref:Phospholipase A2 n=1 Tax=Parelaphostrongylus tenuis TaxID=148309 RepID=A0AAD5R5Y1_PARTN|nr:hypothetical protein KIN20_032012 [Parelaphostrongylus tenuis]
MDSYMRDFYKVRFNKTDAQEYNRDVGQEAPIRVQNGVKKLRKLQLSIVFSLGTAHKRTVQRWFKKFHKSDKILGGKERKIIYNGKGVAGGLWKARRRFKVIRGIANDEDKDHLVANKDEEPSQLFERQENVKHSKISSPKEPCNGYFDDCIDGGVEKPSSSSRTHAQNIWRPAITQKRIHEIEISTYADFWRRMLYLVILCLLKILDLVPNTQSAPPSVAHSLLDMGQVSSCILGYSPMIYIGYGCWCGFGGESRAIDEIDSCCMDHDICYNSPVSNGTCFGSIWKYVQPYSFQCTNQTAICSAENNACQSALCACDVAMAKCWSKYPKPQETKICSNPTDSSTENPMLHSFQ